MTEKDTSTTPAHDYFGYKFIALRAYDLWEKRGRPHASPAVDWEKAIEDIRREMVRQSGA